MPPSVACAGVVEGFRIGREDTRVSLVRFTKHSDIQFHLNEHFKKDDVIEAIDDMGYRFQTTLFILIYFVI